MIVAVQYTEGFAVKERAYETFEMLQTQQAYLGGRVLAPVNQIDKVCWRLQVFFGSENVTTHTFNEHAQQWLPDGCKLVMLKEHMYTALGIYPELVRDFYFST
jgi:hypothetical protein